MAINFRLIVKICAFYLLTSCSSSYMATVEILPLKSNENDVMANAFYAVEEKRELICADRIQLLEDRISYSSSCEFTTLELAAILNIEGFYFVEEHNR